MSSRGSSSHACVLSTQTQKPFETLSDVIAAAKAKPDTISYASVGSGSVGHLAMAQLSTRAGIRLVHVPYRGGAPAMNDAIAGHVDLVIGSTALSIPKSRPALFGPSLKPAKRARGPLAPCRLSARAVFPVSRRMLGGACLRRSARRRLRLIGLAATLRLAYVKSASPRSSRRLNRYRSPSADPRSFAASSVDRCRHGVPWRASTTSRRNETVRRLAEQPLPAIQAFVAGEVSAMSQSR